MSSGTGDLSALYYYQEKAGSPGTCTFYSDLKDIKKRGATLKKSKSELNSMISAMLPYTCRDLVSPSYISKQIAKNQIIVILYDSNKTKQVVAPSRTRAVSTTSVQIEPLPQGFIMASIVDKEFYIDVICSAPGYGKHLLEFFMLDAMENKGARSIGLSALPHVLTYYPRFGFTHRKSCDEKGIELTEKITSRIKAKAKLPATSDEAYDDDDFAEYMENLRDNGYGELTGECSKKPLSKKSLKSGNCGINGYYMKYCPK